MRHASVFIISCALAAVVPFLTEPYRFQGGLIPFPGWPTHWEGLPLTELPLTEREKRFDTGFPGRTARFTEGTRELVIRWITEETRKLHASSECFKGLGYRVHPKPVWVDTSHQRWGCFEATRSHEKFRVCERIYDGVGNSWVDVSSWYWAALLGKTRGPWWAITVAERR